MVSQTGVQKGDLVQYGMGQEWMNILSGSKWEKI